MKIFGLLLLASIASSASANTITCEINNGFETVASLKMNNIPGKYGFKYFEQRLIGERPVTIDLNSENDVYTCNSLVEGYSGFYCFKDLKIGSNEFRRIVISLNSVAAISYEKAHIEVDGSSYIVDKEGTWIRNDFESDTSNFGRNDYYDCKTIP